MSDSREASVRVSSWVARCCNILKMLTRRSVASVLRWLRSSRSGCWVMRVFPDGKATGLVADDLHAVAKDALAIGGNEGLEFGAQLFVLLLQGAQRAVLLSELGPSVVPAHVHVLLEAADQDVTDELIGGGELSRGEDVRSDVLLHMPPERLLHFNH